MTALWDRLVYHYRRFGCADHYLIHATEPGRRFGRCMNCLAESPGWEAGTKVGTNARKNLWWEIDD